MNFHLDGERILILSWHLGLADPFFEFVSKDAHQSHPHNFFDITHALFLVFTAVLPVYLLWKQTLLLLRVLVNYGLVRERLLFHVAPQRGLVEGERPVRRGQFNSFVA